MTRPQKDELRKLLGSLIARRSRDDPEAMTSAARGIYEDLAIVLVPLVSEAGLDALVARALQLAQREYPVEGPASEPGEDTQPLDRVSVWLDRQNEQNTIDAAVAMFAALAALLTTLIGESLTTRYLRKAWPDGFSAPRPKRTRA